MTLKVCDRCDSTSNHWIDGCGFDFLICDGCGALLDDDWGGATPQYHTVEE